MDTIINIKIYSNDKNKVDKAFEEIENIYKKYDDIANIYNENSEIYKVNQSKNSVTISPELLELIKIGQEGYIKSNGLLNINIGNLTRMWHNFRESGILPTDLSKVDISNNIKIDGNVLYNDFFALDLGSIAKGYVTEKAGKYLENNNLEYYIINAGGNVKVGKSYKGYYSIGIKSPINNDNFYIVKGENISVVTSGGYERFYEYDGIKYHHIIDPNTKYPANYMKSVTVIGKDSTLCDMLSTTLFLMSVDDGKEFIKDYDVDVIWYTLDDEIIKNEGFKYE